MQSNKICGYCKHKNYCTFKHCSYNNYRDFVGQDINVPIDHTKKNMYKVKYSSTITTCKDTNIMTQCKDISEVIDYVLSLNGDITIKSIELIDDDVKREKIMKKKD